MSANKTLICSSRLSNAREAPTSTQVGCGGRELTADYIDIKPAPYCKNISLVTMDKQFYYPRNEVCISLQVGAMSAVAGLMI